MPVVPPMGPTSGGYVPGYQVNARPPKKHRGLKIFGIVMASILGAIALVYFAGVIVFSGRFFPQSTIIGMDISGKTPEEVHQDARPRCWATTPSRWRARVFPSRWTPRTWAWRSTANLSPTAFWPR